ncbi:MAG: GvpL/GvpF family gas vesicle protein [Bacteroidota bacterium]
MNDPGNRNRAAEILGQLFAELTRRNRLKDLLERSSPEGPLQDFVRKLADGLESLVATSVPPVPVQPPPTPPAPDDLLVHLAREVSAETTVREEVKTPPPPVQKSIEPIREKPRIPARERPEVSGTRKEPEVSLRHHVVAKQPIEIPGEMSFYCHGVSGIPTDDKPAAKPFALEEKGIDGQRLAFGWDYGSLRFYLSLMRDESVALAKGGALLLPKQEGIRLRGVHEAIVNDLRLHGVVLPFSFGTVIRGWEETQQRLIVNIPRFQTALEKLKKTKKWTLTVSALDNRFADLQQNPTLEKRRELDRHRISYSSVAGTKRIDLRELEHVLNKQRRVAEGIHKELSTVADRTEVLSIVSLQSGSSDEWKQILRASYEVSPTMVSRFHRMVTDVQYEHLLLELMIALTGDVESAALLGGHPG